MKAASTKWIEAPLPHYVKMFASGRYCGCSAHHTRRDAIECRKADLVMRMPVAGASAGEYASYE